jgi:hypothetical protein
MKYFYIILLILPTIDVFSQDIVINEIQANDLDWIELKNTTSSTIDISDYLLTDDPNFISKWNIPTGTSISAYGFLVILADNTNTGLHSNFTLSPGGETIVLSHQDGTEIHQVEYPSLLDGLSYGLLSDNSLSLMSSPTQGTSNQDASAFQILNDLTISTPSGIYASAQTVTLSNTGVGQIYYTLDGTEPDNTSTLYSSPIVINTNTVLKAILIDTPVSFSRIKNRSYIFGATHDLPVIIITSDNSSFNSVNKEVIDGRVEFNFIEPDGTVALSQYAEFKTSGVTSSGMPQLNGKIKAKAAYGDNDFDYKMFPNKSLDKFGGFLLRNASQDWAQTHMRDAFISRLLGDDNLADFPFEGYRPAVLYVNAKYQGIINVREDDDDVYVKDNFNLDDDEYAYGGQDFAIYNFTTDRTLLDSRINFNNHVNMHFLVYYADINEWGFDYWKDLTGETGYLNHYFYHDFDPTFGLYGFNHVPLAGPMNVSYLVPSEMQSHLPYKTEALQFIAAGINHIYNTTRAIGILEAMEDELESEISSHATANTILAINQGYTVSNDPPFADLAEWQTNVQALRTDIINRLDANIFTHIQNEYSLDPPIQVTYESSDITHGYVKVHNIKSINETFTGTYFPNVPIKFTAEPLPGYRFVQWQGDFTSTDKNIVPVFSTNANIVAVFEPITFSGSNNLVINEVQGKNNTTFADETGEFNDWIEIYNPTSSDIDLAGYFISDNSSEPLKWQIPSTDPTKTTVVANGYLLLWADKDLEQGENHLNFKLQRTDEVILTAPDASTLIQEISFENVPADASYGAEIDASVNYIIFNVPTPNATNSTTSSVIENNINTFVKTYPTPVNDKLTISLNTKSEATINIFISTLSGVKIDNVVNQKFSAGQQTFEWNVSNVSNGMYLLYIKVDDTIQVKKIIVHNNN